MSRYVIKFSKEGSIRYISHLDLLRLFKRSFKRVDIKLQHTQGFNPHPKMSFAQPLSLGYYSSGEYLEFETAAPYPAGEILERIKSVLPEGLCPISCDELPAGGKTLAALTEYASYEISLPAPGGISAGSISEEAAKLMEQDKIIVIRHQKKSAKDLEIDIKPMITEFSGIVDNNNIILTMKLSAGSSANLNPEILLSAFCKAVGIIYDRAEVIIKRKEINFRNN